MITEKNIDIDYLLKLDEEVEKDERKFISLVKDRFVKSLLCKNIILLKKFLIYVLDLDLCQVFRHDFLSKFIFRI